MIFPFDSRAATVLLVIMNCIIPRKLGRFGGKTWSLFTVHIRQSGLNRTLWERNGAVEIIASSPAEACNAVRDEFAPQLDAPTEFFCAGAKGGLTSRFVDFESLICAKMFSASPTAQQLALFSI
jgi:hypothetical protein